jgi:HEAT repeat protein
MRTDLLRTLATNFGSNSVLAAKAIREMYLLDPVGFPPAVEEILRDGSELPGASYLMAILVAEPDWLRTVCNPEKYALEQSLDLVRRARKLDPCSEVKLAKMLSTLKFTSPEDTRFATRVLDVLGRSPDPSTALPALRQLSQCPNAKVRSKAALLIGRIIRNPQWADQGSAESDPRVTANAIESLWGMNSPAAREAFFRAARDKYHRIAGNGIVGLYLMGDPSSIPFLFHLSRSEKTLSRATAGWAMGHLEDPRYLSALARLMEDPDPMARKGAFKSMARVRQKMTQMRAAGDLRVQIQDCECRGEAHLVRFTVTIEGQPVPGLDLRRFVAWNGPDLVEEFVSPLQDGAAEYYEIAFQGPPSSTHLVKVQVYSESGAGEDTGFETTFEQ